MLDKVSLDRFYCCYCSLNSKPFNRLPQETIEQCGSPMYILSSLGRNVVATDKKHRESVLPCFHSTFVKAVT